MKWSSLKLRLLRFLIKPKTHVFLTNIYLESYLNIVSTCRSIKSWDSHTHYQEFKEPDDDPVFFPSRPMQSIVCYCDMATLKTPRTILRVLLVVSCYTQRFLNFWKNPFAIFNWNLIGVDYCEKIYLKTRCSVKHW